MKQQQQGSADNMQLLELNRILDLSSDIIAIVTPQGERRSVNKAAADLLGYTQQELIGGSIFDIVYEADREATKEAFFAVPTAKRKNGFENRILRRDGTQVSMVWDYVWDDQTSVIYAIGKDITEQKKQEEQLRNNEKHYQSLIKNLKIGVLKQEKDSRISVSNDAALEMLGLTEDQLLGKTSFDPDWNVIHSDGTDFPGSEHPVPVAIATQKPVRDVVMGVYRPKTKDRSWLLVNAEPQFDLAGEFDHVICTFTDITNERRSLVQKQEALIDILDNTEAFFATFDLNFRFTFMNRAMRKALGVHDTKDVNTISIADIPILDARYSQEERLKILLSEGSWSGSNRIQTHDGKEITIWLVLLMHRNESGIPTHISVSAIDISDSEALKEERNLNKIQAEFVNMVSHEFRTPLTIFRTSIELFQLYLQQLQITLPEKLGQRLEIMDKEIDRLINVIADLITIGKVNSGSIRVNKQNESILTLIQQCIDRNHLTQQDNRVIRLTSRGTERNVMIDAFLMTHVMDNMISNAIKYSPGAPAPEIEVLFEKHHFEILVRDYGMGLTPADQEKVFTSFFRGTNAEHIPGTGLGLVIIKKFIDLHGGKLSLQSEPGKQTEFRIRLYY
ncbi:MAG: PAS domain-containing sensor histidine kinase [Bacteroidota bacterium]|nr:PAS domain-containing sensor histidine kinase [Bacteroidota bacterium]